MDDREDREKHLCGTLVDGKLLTEWDMKWELLDNAFSEHKPELRHVVGLVRVHLMNEIKYIFRATEVPGGISKGLRRISGPPQTGNSGYGATMIRNNINQVKVDILPVQEGSASSEITKDLKKAMVKLHDPEWNRAHQKWMTAIKESTAQK